MLMSLARHRNSCVSEIGSIAVRCLKGFRWKFDRRKMRWFHFRVRRQTRSTRSGLMENLQ